ncbi:phage major capsid protein [Paenirhodobacter sp.]|uniref:phage major capsid protein n=1 Tax=Paenirhodobacter sp. TaxID=1965326 RepID=UPI003B40F737
MTAPITDLGAGLSAGGVAAMTRFAPSITAEILPEAGDARTVALSFSSEAPVLREFPGVGLAYEVLGHGPGEADLSRVTAGVVPLLLDHKREVAAKVGTVTRAWIEGGRGKALATFAATPEGDAMLARVTAGEVSATSAGYQPTAFEVVETAGDGLPIVRARWQLLEISLVSVPADISVGVGRSFTAPQNEGSDMTTPTTLPVNPAPTGPATAAANATASERARVREITATAARFKLPADMTAAAIDDGMSVRDFQMQALEVLGTDESTATRSRSPALHLGGERAYSLTRAVAAEVSGDWRAAGFERELSQEVGRSMGRTPSGVWIPPAVLGRAVVTTATAPSLIGTHHAAESFIDALRPEVQVMNLGATVLPGLVENVSIPRMVAGTAAEWIAEDSAVSESDPEFDAVSLTLHQLAARTQISRRQLKQSLPGLDTLLQADLRKAIAVALDDAAINGAGTATVPRGILNTSGIGSVAIGTNGGDVEFPKLTALMAEVEGENVAGTSYGWLMSHKLKADLMSKLTADAGPMMILERIAGQWEIAGYKAAFSSLVPSNGTKGSGTGLSTVIFGNWSDMIIGQWGGIDLIVDNVTEAAKGNVRIIAHSEWDIALRHAESFAAITDAVTG